MTSFRTGDAVDDYYTHLPPWAVRALWRTKRVKHLVGAATSRGWTPEQLAADTTAELEHHYRPGRVITARLDRCSTMPPPAAKPASRKVHAGCCDNGFIYDETTDPPTVTRCPGAAR